MKRVSAITIMLLVVVFSSAALAQHDNLILDNGSSIMGIVTDTASNPIEFTVVSYPEGYYVHTDSAGAYRLKELEAGNYSIDFLQQTSPYHSDSTVFNVAVAENETTYLNITLLPEPAPALFWNGGYFDGEYQWHDTIYAGVNQWIDIPIYFMGGPDVAIENMNYPLAVRYDLIDEFDQDACQMFYPLTSWCVKEFSHYNDDSHPTYPNPAGYHSLSFFGFARCFYDEPLLRSTVPLHIMSFRVHTKNDPNHSGQIFDNALTAGMDPVQGPANAGDSTGARGYSLYLSHACLALGDGAISGLITDGYGDPIDNVVVGLEGYPLSKDTTGADGLYEFAGLFAGTYEISFSHPDYCDTVISNVEVVSGSTTTLNVALGASSLSGIVYNDEMDPVSGIIVTLLDEARIDTSDINGAYRFDVLCQGYYDLEFSDPGYCKIVINGIHIGIDDTVEVDAVLNNNSRITGTVTNAELEPVMGAIVSIVDMLIEDTTDINGEYELAGLCPNTYDVNFAYGGFCNLTITHIVVGANETVVQDMQFLNEGIITGTITDNDQLPLSEVVVTVVGTDLADTSDVSGEYEIYGLCSGTFDAEFTKDGYWKMPERGIYVSRYFPSVIDVVMCPISSIPAPLADTVIIWAGGHFDNCVWYDTVTVQPGMWLDIPIYFIGSPDALVDNICYPLGARYDIIDQFGSAGCSSDFWPFNDQEHPWIIQEFIGYNSDYYDGTNRFINPPGYHSLTFLGFRTDVFQLYQGPFLHSEIPMKILTFRVHISDSLEANDQVYDDALIAGMDPVQGPANAGDSTGEGGYVVSSYYSRIKVSSNQQAYLPGDANMAAGVWPPLVIGWDVTYMINFFKGYAISPACYLDGFWCSADVNGDCRVIGSDVTKLVNHFRGLTEIEYCPDYPPLWPTPADLPAEAPPGWPNCE